MRQRPPLRRWPKAIARRMQGSRVGLAVSDFVLLHHYGRWARAVPGADRLVHWLARLDMSSRDRRTSSVHALVELFFRLVDGLAIERFVEAGAKEASASRRAAKLSGVREVIAFEANPYTYRRFQKRLSKHAVRYEHLALSDAAGEVTFLVRLREDGVPMADGQASLLVRPDHTPGYEKVAVNAVRLDDYFSAPTGRRTAMWVDVEGASSLVLEGGRTLLDETDLVMIEVEEQQVWEGQQWLRPDVVRELARHDLVPIARDRQSRGQFNIVFVRKSIGLPPVVADALEVFRRDAIAEYDAGETIG